MKSLANCKPAVTFAAKPATTEGKRAAMTMNNTFEPHASTIVLAGATGDLGGRIARALLAKGALVRGLARSNSDREKVEALRKEGATICEVDFHDAAALAKACEGATCVVSALSGLWASKLYC